MLPTNSLTLMQVRHILNKRKQYFFSSLLLILTKQTNLCLCLQCAFLLDEDFKFRFDECRRDEWLVNIIDAIAYQHLNFHGQLHQCLEETDGILFFLSSSRLLLLLFHPCFFLLWGKSSLCCFFILC